MDKKTQKLILVRHAESKYNEAVRLDFEKRGIEFNHINEENPEIRFGDGLFDASITEKGVQQVHSFWEIFKIPTYITQNCLNKS